MSEEISQSSKMEKGAVAMVVVMMCGSFLSALNQNLANTALPTYMQVFGVSMGKVQWLITVYTLANGVMIPVTAYLIERFSTRSMYYLAMSLFVLSTFSNGAVGAAQIPVLQNVLVVMFVIAAVLFVWSLFMFRKACLGLREDGGMVRAVRMRASGIFSRPISQGCPNRRTPAHYDRTRDRYLHRSQFIYTDNTRKM